MALTPERILELAGLAPDRKVCASTCMTRKIDKKPCKCYPGMRYDEALALAKAVEAEVRKEYEALIRQMLDALETCDSADGYNGPYQFHDDKAVESAITAARARLGERT